MHTLRRKAANASQTVWVVVAGASPVTMEGLCTWLQQAEDLGVYTSSPDAGRLLKILSGLSQVDVVVLDVHTLPAQPSATSAWTPYLHTIAVVRKRYPTTPLVLIADPLSQAQWVVRAFQVGATGLLSPNVSADEALATIRMAAEGWTILPGDVVVHLFRTGSMIPTNVLTPREWEVLQLIAEGKTNAEIAAHLKISTATVRKHVEHIREKLGVSTRGEAVAEARRRGWPV